MNSLAQISNTSDPRVLRSYGEEMRKALIKRFTICTVCEIEDEVMDRATDIFHGYIKTMDEVLRKRFTGQMVDEIEQEALDKTSASCARDCEVIT